MPRYDYFQVGVLLKHIFIYYHTAICRAPVSDSSHNFTVRGSLITISCGADEDIKYTATCHSMNATWAPDPGEYCNGVNIGVCYNNFC